MDVLTKSPVDGDVALDARTLSVAWDVTRQDISKLKRDGKLVLAPGNRIWRKASERKRAAERDPRGGKPDRMASASPDFYESRARREAAEAELAELKVSKARGELMPRSDCEAICVGAFTMARAEWQVIPTRMAERLAGLSASEVKTILTAEVDSILRGMADALRSNADELEAGDADAD